MNIVFGGFRLFLGFAALVQTFTEIRTADIPPRYSQWKYRISQSDKLEILTNTLYKRNETTVCLYRVIDNHHYFKKYKLPNTDYHDISEIQDALKSHNHLVFIIHGFLDDGQPGWTTYLGEGIKRQLNRAMVFTVDWSSASKTLNYTAVFLSALEVSHILANFLREIYPKDETSNAQVHIIGHGLGAQIGRMVVPKVPFRIYRLTCLDPFKIDYEFFPTNRYDLHRQPFHTDVIHTDGYTNGFGDPRAIGTVDFYMNIRDRTTDDQPGCRKHDVNIRDILHRASHLEFPRDEAHLKQILRLLAQSLCSHGRAVDYFVESVLNPFCKFSGRSLEEFGKLRVLGLETFDTIDRHMVPLKVYADTNSSYPFCPYSTWPPEEVVQPPQVEVDTRIKLI